MPSPADARALPPPLLLVGGPPLFGETSSVQQRMARAWHAEGGTVLYLEVGGHPATFRARAKKPGHLAKADERLFVLRLEKLAALPWSYPDAVRRINLKRNLPRVKKALAEAGLREGSFVALYYGWYWREWLDELPAAAHVYDCIDEHRAYPHVAARPSRAAYVWAHERRMLERADVLAATSPALLEDRAALARAHALLPNGVDAQAWSASVAGPRAFDLPEDLAKLPAPRAVLLGHLQPKLDFAAVGVLARARPDAGVALIGPCERGTRLPAERKNLRWLGAKPYGEAARYLAHASIGLLPLLPTAYNRASCPLKLLEYLAAGLPVAASRIPAVEALAERHPDLVHVADGPEDFARAAGAAFEAAARVPRERIAQSVQGETWNARVGTLARLVQAGAR
ncbi:MAG: glycosyltransferase [Planctomycetota bacterium]|nr:glycosyltransferase [Planctomycetota bacterium]